MQVLERVARLARRQYGLITHEQCLALGLTIQQIRTLLASGAWRMERRGVYVVGGVPPSWEQTLCAVTLPFDDCWITHGTGARHWDMRHAPQIGKIEALRPYGKVLRLHGVVLHRSRIIVPDDVTVHRRIPVTSRARTIVECAARLNVKQTGQLIDEYARIDKSFGLERVRACFARLAGGGRRRLQSVKEALMGRIPGYDPGESDLELSTLRTLISAGLPIPLQQHRMVLNGKRVRIDLAYPDDKVAIELQSWEFHKGYEPFHDDKARIGDLVAEGWRALEVTSRHAPEDIVRRVGGALRHARAA